MMKRTLFAIMTMFGTSMALLAEPSETLTLRFIQTSDVHGAFFPYDFIEQRPMEGTMARVSTYVNQQRRQYGERLILLDNGDILQGQPTCYYSNYVTPEQQNIASEVINYLKYDAETIGNHDVEAGHAVYDKWIRETRCPVLGANVIDRKSRQPYLEPYVLLERSGVRIAVLGMLTPAIPNWLHESLWSGMYFEEMVASARKWVKLLREREEADLVIGLFHSGWDGGLSTMHYDEDATRKVAEQVDGFDVIFFGHDHTEHQSTTANHTLCLNPSCNAVKVAAATLELRRQGNRWRVARKHGEIVDIRGQQVDSAYVSHFQPAMERVRSFVERQIGTSPDTLRTRDCFFGPSAFTDYIHELQLSHTHADISFNAPLTFDSEIAAGPVYMSDMFKLYRYENQIYVLRMTGEEVRKHLEMSYDQWVNTMTSPDDHIMLLNDVKADESHTRFRFPTFNFDSACGIDYDVDVTKPNGQKVHIRQMSNGEPFDEHKWYRVAMNSYRGNGGGELLMRGAGIPLDSIPSRIEYMSERDQRHYLTQQIEREGTIKAHAHANWRFIPEAWAAPAIRRDRELIFGH